MSILKLVYMQKLNQKGSYISAQKGKKVRIINGEVLTRLSYTYLFLVVLH